MTIGKVEITGQYQKRNLFFKQNLLDNNKSFFLNTDSKLSSGLKKSEFK